ncbi:MAG: UvrD-helicase domain-containing protein, partial [Clostridia bacterium]|nr:UvrD-helicase domain-containing protein [Clostridia bacterium]
ARLETIGNIRSDGRPILGMDCRDLLEVTLEACPEAIFIPAHIWTPHFSVLGAFSGFNSIEECFGDLSSHIHALETGLSSDPVMNRKVSSLDKYLLVSNSDAHSPAKLGRECNMLTGELSYRGLQNALTTGENLLGTLEFYPEEGKYHLDGHRNCNLRLEPSETAAYGGRCPVCGKKITVGVLNRVEALADRSEIPENAAAHRPYESIIPLPEVIGACLNCGPDSKRAQTAYLDMLGKLGPELEILRAVPLDRIEQVAGPAVSEGIRRLRAGKVRLEGGYDGEYGKISLFDPGELEQLAGQIMMAGLPGLPLIKKRATVSAPAEEAVEAPSAPADSGMNEGQSAAVHSDAAAIAVIAGPGTGKTLTLVERIAHLIESGKAKPGEITAVTFTNQAASEMRARLEARLGGKKAVKDMTIGTFHAICLSLLGKKTLIGQSEAMEILKGLPSVPSDKSGIQEILESISRYKNLLTDEKPALFDAYSDTLSGMNCRDLDDLLVEVLDLDVSGKHCFRHLLVDEFQDINALQRRLVMHFSASAKSLFVIGDPDQSIYGFRGADAGCFDALKQLLPDLEIIRLTENYRCAPEILEAAMHVIKNNPGEKRILNAHRPGGPRVRVVTGDSPYDEGAFIAREIANMTGGLDMNSATDNGTVRAFSDIAILCRTRRQLTVMETCLKRGDIPCVITGREDYLDSDSVRGALAFFRTLQNPEDHAALKACLSLGFGVSEEIIAEAHAITPLISEPKKLIEAVGVMGPLAPWAYLVSECLPLFKKSKPKKLIELWEKHMGSDEHLTLLKSAAMMYSDMNGMLDGLMLGQEADISRASSKNPASGAVRLMTLHAAKGLEFPVVFLSGVSKGSLPLERKDEAANVEEERRLFFVGITRAREELIITTDGEPSQFIGELPETVQRAAIPQSKPMLTGKQLSFF